MIVLPTRRRHRSAALVLALAASGALLFAAPPPLAGASPDTAREAATGSTIRVAHFSPDTPQMDVYAAGFDGVESLVLPKLGFGMVSQYMRLPAGTYAFSMRPQGSPATSEAALRVSATLSDGEVYTFAAFGRSADLQTDLLTDDMAAPGAGGARVRIIQGAGDAGRVDVTSDQPALFAMGSGLGSVGPYVDLPAGDVAVTASAEGEADEVSRLDLAAGTVTSLVVLDDPAGGLQVVSVTDGTGTPGGIATPTGMPAGGIDTGGGGAAAGVRPAPGGNPFGVAAVGLGGVTIVVAAVWCALALVGRRSDVRAG